jgi:hypothetical protein
MSSQPVRVADIFPPHINAFNLLAQYRSTLPGKSDVVEIGCLFRDSAVRASAIQMMQLFGVYYPMWGHTSPISCIMQTLMDYTDITELSSHYKKVLKENFFSKVFHPFTTTNTTLYSYSLLLYYLRMKIIHRQEGDLPYAYKTIQEEPNSSRKSVVVRSASIKRNYMEARYSKISEQFLKNKTDILVFNKEFALNFTIPTHNKVLTALGAIFAKIQSTSEQTNKPAAWFIDTQTELAKLIHDGDLLKEDIDSFMTDVINFQKECATRVIHAHEIAILKLSGVERYYESDRDEATASASGESLNWFNNSPALTTLSSDDNGGAANINQLRLHYINSQPTSWLQLLYPITEDTMPLLFEKTKKPDTTKMEEDIDTATQIHNQLDQDIIGICSLTDPDLIPRPSLFKNPSFDRDYLQNRTMMYVGKIEKLTSCVQKACRDIGVVLLPGYKHQCPPDALHNLKATHTWLNSINTCLKNMSKDMNAELKERPSLVKIESTLGAKEDVVDLIWCYFSIILIVFGEYISDDQAHDGAQEDVPMEQKE